MNNKQIFATFMLFAACIALALILFSNSGRPACIKMGDEVFFTETLRVISNGAAVDYELNGKRIYSNNVTYFYVENEKDCEEIGEIFK